MDGEVNDRAEDERLHEHGHRTTRNGESPSHGNDKTKKEHGVDLLGFREFEGRDQTQDEKHY